MTSAHELHSPHGRVFRLAVGCLVAGGIGVADWYFDLRGALSPLVVVPFAIGGWQLTRYWIALWAIVCAVLTLGPVVVANRASLSGVDDVRLLASIVALGAIGYLLDRNRQIQQFRSEAEDALTEMRRIADLAPIFLWRADKGGHVSFFNQRFTELTGRDVDEMVENQSWPDILHPDDQVVYMRMREEAKLDESERQLRVRVKNPAGGYLWALVTRRPTRNAAGEITGWIGGASNIDAEVKARDEVEHLNNTLEQRVSERTAELALSESRLRTLLNDLNIAYLEIDISEAKRLLDESKKNGASSYRELAEDDPEFVARCMSAIRLVGLNEALITMLGYEDYADWQAHQPIVPIEDPQQVLNLKLEAIFEDRRQFTGSTVLVTKQGQRVPVAFGANVPADWSTSMCTLIDISEKQRAHDAMLAAREELARANRAATIGALSTTLAHELNQPIQAIVVDTQTCMRWLDMDPPQIPQAMKALERLSKNGDRMSGIVQRTREHLVKRDRNLLPVNIVDLVRETHGLLERDLASRNTTLRVIEGSESPIVRADPVELQQVFINLISNAAEAMNGARSERRIDVRIGNQRCGNLIMKVEDNGPGLPDELIESVFDPFFTTKPGGMGMGLQICRTIIESFGGKLWASNREEGGAAFHFTQPASDVVNWRSAGDRANLCQ
jgi:PAS domain S-box-containing protein